MSSDIKIEALAPKDDLSAKEDPSFRVYSASLGSAFGNPKIRNLALSGSLGSGKSSIIRSFDRERNGEKRFLYVSLIDFSKSVTNEKAKPYDQRQLESSLLDQILSCCTSDKVPEGSIRGIPEKFEFLDLSARSLTLLCLSAFVLIFHEKFGALAAMFGFPGYLRSNIHLMLYLFAAIVLCGCVYRVLLRCLPFLQISKVQLKSNVAEAEVNLGKEQTTLDTHKFELAYILEQIGEKHDHTVVFEDLERIEPATAVSIMSKLRELNTLTNNHLQARAQGDIQPIRFLYAISDSTMPAEYRTKFYDCIIPVVPVSHPLNSRDTFKQMLGELGIGKEWESALCSALSDAFVDYRTLLSLRNEFQVLQALYDAKSTQANDTEKSSGSRNTPFLFAITAYRILLPECFEWTLSPQGDGILPDLGPAAQTSFEQKNRAKAHEAVRRLFDSGLLDKTSMRLIIGEQALIEQWMKVIRSALDKDAFDEGDEMRIRGITEALQDVFKDIRPDPSLGDYAEFRKAMYERLCTLCYKKNKTQFILTANSLAAVSREYALSDWVWLPPESAIYPVDFPGFLRNYLCWLEALPGGPEQKEYPYAIGCLEALCRDHPERQERVLKYAADLVVLPGRPSPKTMADLKALRNACPENPGIAHQYAKGLTELARDQELPECAGPVTLLKELREAFPESQEIVLEYAKGLVTLSYHQELPECTETIALLQELREAFPENQEIVLQYANGLVNLSYYQELPECAETIVLLKKLRDTFPEHQEIVLDYADGLFNLSNAQKLPERAETIALLKNLREAYPEHQEIALAYAKGLFNLSIEQKLPECGETIALLKNLRETFPEHQEIALAYANGLVNLSAEQELPDRAETIDLLKDLRQAFPDNQEIALQYAKGLFNLSIAQKLPECGETITILKELRETFMENQEIALGYAEGLVNLSAEQELPERAETIALLKNLREAYPDHQEFAQEYTKGLVNLSAGQKLPERAETIALLKNLREAYPDYQEIAQEYAKGLFNLSIEQKLLECTETITLLKNLREAYPENQEITLQYAKGLFNLSCDQALPERVETIALLKELRDAFRENQEIALQYAGALADLSNDQELMERAETIALLKELREAYPEHQEIALQYAGGLLNLSNVQELPECGETIALLKNLREAYPDHQEIALQYAGALANLSYDQALPECTKTIALLKELRDAFPENREIALRYARGLLRLTQVQAEWQTPTTVAELAALLREHPGAIPEFRQELDAYLSRNPQRKELYRPLLELCDAVAAGR